MSLQRAYRLGLGLTLELWLLAVLLGGELPAWCWAALAVVPVAELGHARRRTFVGGAAGTVVALGGLALGVATIVERGVGGVILGGVLAMIVILSARVLTATNLRHDLQGLVVSLLLLFAGAAINGRLTYGVVFLAYAVTAVWALVTRQLVRGATEQAERARDPAGLAATLARRDIVTPTFATVTGGLALCLLLGTSLLFVLFPRIGFGNLGLFAVQTSRFPADVSLAGNPRAGAGAAVLARLHDVSYADFEAGLYLRGPVYDAFAATGFVDSGAPTTMPSELQRTAPGDPTVTYEVFVQPVMGDLIPTLGPVRRARVVAGGQGNPSLRTYLVGPGAVGELRAWAPLTGPARFSVQGAIARPLQANPGGWPAAAPGAARVRAHYLRLPEGYDPRVAELAERIVADADVAGATARERAGALRAYLLRNFTYTLDNPNSGAVDPLLAFLFDDHRGHCEYFATAYGALLRAAGIPSRVVGGLFGGAWSGEPDDPQAVVVFTAGDAHVWVEWLDPADGWLLDDATPSAREPRTLLRGLGALLERLRRAWDDSVVDYSADDQVTLLATAAGAVRSPWQRLRDQLDALRALPAGHAVAAAAAIAVLAWLLRRAARRRRPAHAQLAAALITFVERRTGAPPEAATTLREAVRRAGGSDDAPAAAALTAYEGDRFGGRPVDAARAAELVLALRGAGLPAQKSFAGRGVAG